MTPIDRWVLKPQEAAVLLGIGRSTLYALLAAGVIPSIRIGRAVRVPVDQLKDWLRRQAEMCTPKEKI
jgi:excisionase family DNA binding protein